jgi:hypothetical protein
MKRSSTTQTIREYIQSGKLTPLLLEVFALCAIAALIWPPRRVELNRVVAPDEIDWLNFSADFALELKQDVYSGTYQIEHPGVTLMWVGTAAYKNAFQDYLTRNPEYSDRASLKYFIEETWKQNPLEVLVEARKILALINTILLLLAYGYARRIIGVWPALIGFALIAFDPFHLALTRVMHLDGLLADLYLLSLLAYIRFSQERKPLNLLVSGISAGLAWLTKSPGFFLIPTLGIVALLQVWQRWRQEKQVVRISMIWEEVWPLIIWGLVGAAVFVAAWPAMWVAPLEVLSKVFGNAESYAIQGHSSDIFFNGQIISGGDFGLQYFYFYPLTFLWRTTPLVIIGLVAFIAGYIKMIKPMDDAKIRFFSAALLIAAIVFSGLMTIGHKKFDRYLLPVYPPLDLLAGLGWYAALLWLKNRLPKRTRALAVPFIAGLVIILQAGSSLSLFPNMLAYYDPLMGGSRKAPQVMQIGWGEGLDQAALYLNQKPDAKDLLVSSWYGAGPFSFFFSGETFNLPSTVITANDWQAIRSSDYLVIYVHQWQRNLPAELLSELAGQTPEHSIWINGIEYVRIYKAPF